MRDMLPNWGPPWRLQKTLTKIERKTYPCCENWHFKPCKQRSGLEGGTSLRFSSQSANCEVKLGNFLTNLFRDGRLYSFDALFDRVDLLVHHLNRLLNPAVILKTEEEVERFLGLGQLDSLDLNALKNPIDFWEGDYNTTFLKQLQASGKIPNITDHWNSLRL